MPRQCGHSRSHGSLWPCEGSALDLSLDGPRRVVRFEVSIRQFGVNRTRKEPRREAIGSWTGRSHYTEAAVSTFWSKDARAVRISLDPRRTKV
jgi:hypothetical protein